MCHKKDTFLVTLLAVFTIFSLGCRAQEGNPNIEKDPNVIYVSNTYWKDQPSLQCYECNSEYDPSCGDPFNNYSIGVVNCSVKKVPEHLVRQDTHPGETIRPTVCRKIVQKIDIGKGTTKRVIRECGYIQDQLDDKRCLRRTGTMGTETHYCACTTSFCNDSTSVRPLGICMVFALVAISSMLL